MKHPSGSASSRAPSALAKPAAAAARLVGEVALLLRLPRTKHVFDYAVPAGSEPLAAGDLVLVPFRGRPQLGVLVRTKRGTTVEAPLQPINQLVAPALVTPRQLALAQELTSHYGVNLGSALKLCCPVLPGPRTAIAPLPRPALKPCQERGIRPTVLQLEQTGGRAAIVSALLQRLRQRNSQALVLVPEAHYLPYWQRQLRQFEPATYTSELAAPEQRRVWQGIRDGSQRLTVGTRAALFLPYRHLGGIIIDQADNENYKQSDQNPRYSGTEVADWLARHHGASLALLSPAPSVEAWYDAQRAKVTWRERPVRGTCRVELIDLAALSYAKKSLLSPPLTERVSAVLKRGGTAFLYLNRRGDATAVLCTDCGYSPTCPTCQRPLALTAARHQLTCFHCGTTRPLPLPCPRCGSARVRYRGAGVGELEREVKRLWPGARTVTIEGEHARLSESAVAQAQLVLGSRAALRWLDTATPQLCALVLPDGELALPEWRAAERIWATARQLGASGARELVVQTYQPQHHVWQSLAAHQPTLFYERELHERLPYRYPPHGELVRFTTQSPSEREALGQARALRTKLSPAVPPRCELTGPYPDYYRQRRGRYRFHLLLRYQPQNFDPASLWPLVPDAILIDRHPWNILD